MDVVVELTPIFIGFAGGSGSGKTTLTSAIHDRLAGHRSVVLSLDWYYKNLSHLCPEDRAGVNFDHPEALEIDLLIQQMRQLKSGRAIKAPIYDFTTHTRQPETRLVRPKMIVLVEGILLFAVDAVRSLLDLKIFIDTPADIRFARRLLRDINERGRTVDSCIQQYCATTRPMHFAWVEPGRAFADVTVSGEENIETLTGLLLGHIENRVNYRLKYS